MRVRSPLGEAEVEVEVEEIAERAWRERLRVIVWAEDDRPERPHSIVLREPPAPYHQ
jgi:hypothetical protein